MPQKRSRIALLIETSNVYGRELLRGIHSWAGANDANWSFRLVEQGRGAVAPDWLEGWEGDGIIARVENERIGSALQSLGVPVVDVSAGLEQPLFPRVVTNSEEVIRLAIEHFKELGIVDFAFCGDRSFHWSRVREQHFSSILESEGKRPLVRSSRASKPDTEIGRLAKWLKTLPPRTGVLACYDIRGQEVLEAAREAGLRAPDDLAVLGIHNDEILCELCDPPLSSVIPNARLAGYEAAAVLRKVMTGERVEMVKRISPVGIAKRQSTDLVAIDDPKISAAVTFIQKHACQGISVQDVLAKVPMARTQLERQFRKFLGRTPREQIERVRMERVKELLVRSSLPISAIAESAGYEYPEYLTVAFKRIFGESPRDYRSREQR
ncbi:DNA-binding transcriptional regulator [Pelagicoccus sp. SDUM812005]|uniref:XylR family transcriptional regulator n=1 Tax=Pelagicoccus sp. SDUM812005 TaxID=3041257 RepID=UPI00280F0B59|nr:DNA-binding transcriptional regulator [Pelagicoccus sp. SDUM812005]MDQ8180625.1 DNA-binding transcriptional regulator [Pelagicoccus sp. SDUM812005]